MFVKLIEIGTTWCGPCKAQKEELKDFTLLPLEFIDADEQSEVSDKYEIFDVPSIVAVRDNGTYMVMSNHFITKEELIERLNEYK